MSDKNGEKPQAGHELEALLVDAMVRDGDLVPTTEAEVERAMAEGHEFEGELPEALREYRPEAGLGREAESAQASRRVVSFEEARRARAGTRVITHFVAVLVGAAAASVLLLWKPPTQPGGGVPTSEPVKPVLDASAPDATVALAPLPGCGGDCCAGSACSKAKSELAQCSSGRTCVACGFDALSDSRYRVRLGAFAPLDAGREALKSASAGLELCVRVGSSAQVCTAARSGDETPGAWSELPLAVSVQDLMAGLTLDVRPVGTETVIGTWTSPVQVNPTTLCRGLFIKPTNPKAEGLGTVSLFLDDTSYVELARAADVATLRAERAKLELGAVPARLFETVAGPERRFALVLGPFSKPVADRVRWDLLQKGQQARVVVGDDFSGAPLPLE